MPHTAKASCVGVGGVNVGAHPVTSSVVVDTPNLILATYSMVLGRNCDDTTTDTQARTLL